MRCEYSREIEDGSSAPAGGRRLRGPQVPLHRVGKTGDVRCRDDGGGERSCKAGRGIAAELGAKAPGPYGQESVHNHDEQPQGNNHPNHGDGLAWSHLMDLVISSGVKTHGMCQVDSAHAAVQ